MRCGSMAQGACATRRGGGTHEDSRVTRCGSLTQGASTVRG